jgi:hypothetical protein
MFVFLWFLIKNKYIRNQINHMAELEKGKKLLNAWAL